MITLHGILAGFSPALGPPPPSYLLDTYPNATFAHAYKRMKSTDINVCRLRRDSTERDFTSTELEDGTYTTWKGADTVYMVQSYTWDGSINWSQPIVAEQPMFNNVIGHLAPESDGTKSFAMSSDFVIPASGNFMAAVVLKRGTGSLGEACVFAGGNNATSMLKRVSGSPFNWQGRFALPPVNYGLSSTVANDLVILVFGRQSGDTFYFYQNEAVGTPNNTFTNGVTQSRVFNTSLGGYTNSVFGGSIAFAAVWQASNIPSSAIDVRNALNNIYNAY